MNRGKANIRVHRELQLLSNGSAAPGITAWPRDDRSRLDILDAEICGAAETPYEGGVFKLEVNIPPEYPLKPPRVRFLTNIYHPNIDSDGRICLDSLSMPPKGAWKPSLTIATLLTSIQALMSSPNADDGLMADITDEYRQNPKLFNRKARSATLRHATPEKNSLITAPEKQATLTIDSPEDVPQTELSSQVHPVPDIPLSGVKEDDASRSRLRKRPRLS